MGAGLRTGMKVTGSPIPGLYHRTLTSARQSSTLPPWLIVLPNSRETRKCETGLTSSEQQGPSSIHTTPVGHSPQDPVTGTHGREAALRSSLSRSTTQESACRKQRLGRSSSIGILTALRSKSRWPHDRVSSAQEYRNRVNAPTYRNSSTREALPMRRILLISSGLTPQVVTEMLWWFVAAPDGPGVLPDEIYIVTTRAGANVAHSRLLGPCGKLAEFSREFGLPSLHDRLELRFPTEEDIGPGDDIRDLEANIGYANLIARLLLKLTADPSTQVHASLVGGRKTMSFYMGYAMSLLGREQDELSHLLVSLRCLKTRLTSGGNPSARISYTQDGTAKYSARTRHPSMSPQYHSCAYVTSWIRCCLPILSSISADLW